MRRAVTFLLAVLAVGLPTWSNADATADTATVVATSFQSIGPLSVIRNRLPASDRTAYKISGSRQLRPSAIYDDGLRTYIQWPTAQAIPAVFAMGPHGVEEVVNGDMRGDFYTIDRVYGLLIFRIDEAKTVARRRAQDRQ